MKITDIQITMDLETYLNEGGKNLAGRDLAGLEITDAILSGINGHKVNLTGARLKDVVFRGGDWTLARFEGATLENCHFQGISPELFFNGATLQECSFDAGPSGSMTGAFFKGAKLEGVRFRANMIDCSFTRAAGTVELSANAVHSGCDFEEVRVRLVGRVPHGSKTRLAEIDFSGADLDGVDFRASALTNCQFRGAGLRGCNLSGLDLSGLDFSGADLTGARIHHSNIAGTNFEGARLADVEWNGSNLLEAITNDPDVAGIKMILKSLQTASEVMGPNTPWVQDRTRGRGQ